MEKCGLGDAVMKISNGWKIAILGGVFVGGSLVAILLESFGKVVLNPIPARWVDISMVVGLILFVVGFIIASDDPEPE
jgi:DMSO reductase anchor subunit